MSDNEKVGHTEEVPTKYVYYSLNACISLC